jgi:zinc protease
VKRQAMLTEAGAGHARLAPALSVLSVCLISLLGVGAFGQTRAPQAIPSYKDLKYPALGQVHVPEPATFTLSNGMRVFLLEDHELPLVQGYALVRTGNLFDPPEKRGLAELTADVLRSGGTHSKTGDQIDEELENIAASVESSMGETNASLSFAGLKESADAVLAVFKEVVTNPEFRQDKLDLALAQARSGIARRNDEAQGIAERELSNILYGRDTPYGWTIEYEHLARIHREDLQQFYRRYYFPKNMLLAVYGDFSTAEMKEKLERLFADWQVEQPAVPPFPAVTAKAAPGIFLAEKPDVTQTFFTIGLLGGTLRDPDYPALEVASHILGSGFTSRLMSQIRTKLGYAYSIGAGWGAAYDHPGTFRIVGSTKSATTTETIAAIRTEVDKMRAAEVTEQELATAKDSVLNSFVFFFDSPAKTLNRTLTYQYFGYPKDFLTQYQKEIAAVTRADVLRVFREHVQPNDLTIVAVGNPKDFGKPLSTLGKVERIDLTIPELKPAAQADPASVGRGKGLLERARQAMGGADKLMAIKDSIQSSHVVLNTPGGDIKIVQRSLFLAPSYIRQEQEVPDGRVIAFTDGTSGWQTTPEGIAPMSAEVLKQAQDELSRRLVHLMLADQDASLTLQAGEKNSARIARLSGEAVRIEFDEATGLPVREFYQAAGEGAEVAQTFADWRDVDGIKMPYRITFEQSGKKVATAEVDEYKFNTGLKAEDVNRP